jgi:hypothetical protein
MKRACKECRAKFEAKSRIQVYCCPLHQRKAGKRLYAKRHRETYRRASYRYYLEHREKMRLASRRYKQEHREEVARKQKARARERRLNAQRFYERHREEVIERARRYRRENRELIQQRQNERYLLRQLLRLKIILAERFEMSEITKVTTGMIAELRGLTTEQLKHELVDRLGLTAQSLLRTACLVAVLEERGEDLSGLKIGLLNHLRKIATGKLLPEIVVQFAGNSKLINRISELSITDQRRILAGADPKEILRLEAPLAPRFSPAGHSEKSAVRQEQAEEVLAQRPEAVIPAGSPRDVAEYLFHLIVKHDQPGAVMGHLRQFFDEWEAGGKWRRIVLEDIA